MPRPRSSPRATVSPRIQIPELSFALWILPREIDGFRELNTWKLQQKNIDLSRPATRAPTSERWTHANARPTPCSTEAKVPRTLHPAMALCWVADPGAVSTKTQDWP